MLLFTPFPIPIPIPIPVPFFGGLPNTKDLVEEEEEQVCGGRVVWRRDHIHCFTHGLSEYSRLRANSPIARARAQRQK